MSRCAVFSRTSVSLSTLDETCDVEADDCDEANVVLDRASSAEFAPAEAMPKPMQLTASTVAQTTATAFVAMPVPVDMVRRVAKLNLSSAHTSRPPGR